MKTTVVIPFIRPSRILALRLAIKFGPEYRAGNVEILAEEDKDRIGVTHMVKRLVERSSHETVTFLGDDCIPHSGFIGHAFEVMASLPDGWGLVGLNDEVHGPDGLATHWMAHKNLLPLLGGEFFHTGYRHCFCDQELIIRCRELGRYAWAEKAVITHDHPQLKGEAVDTTEYIGYQQANFMHDKVLFHKRRRHGWP